MIIALISIICRRYYEALQEKLLSDNHHSFRQLEELRKLQLAISTLVHKVAEVFSPLILISVGCNVVYILVFLYSGLEADLFSPSFLVRLIFTYSFIYVVLRLVFSVFLASRLSEMVYILINYFQMADKTVDTFLLIIHSRRKPSTTCTVYLRLLVPTLTSK